MLSDCGQKVERNPNTFVESSIGDARRLNPVIANDSASGTINDLVFNGLVKYDKDIRLIGDLAESLEDFKRWQDYYFLSPKRSTMARWS